MWIVRLLVCNLHCVFATGVNISTGTKDLYITENQTTWWDARRNCKTVHEKDLYIADKEPLPSVLDGILKNDTFYWVGAMRYSKWIWTFDEIPLYSHVGYSVRKSEGKNLPHNSVYACHLACRNRMFQHGLGLSDNKCYCINEPYEATNTSAEQMQCPGNLDEKCGNSTGMSVYTLPADFEFTPTQHGSCGYAVVNQSVSVKLSHYRSCLTQGRRPACYQSPPQGTDFNESVNVSQHTQSWIQAYHNCSLVKLDNSTLKQLKEIAPKNGIWIGLAYKVSRKWINGNNSYGYEDYYPFLNSPIQMCLALNTGRTRKLYWLPCSRHLASICEATATSTPASASIPSTTQSASSGENASVPSTDGQSVEGGHADGWKGVLIGLSMGNVILFLVVIALALLLQRQRKLRLNAKKTYEQTSIKTSAENATCSPDVARDNGDYTYISPDTLDGKPFCHPVSTATVNPTRNLEKICTPVPDVEKETSSKQHIEMPTEAPHMYLHDYDKAECIQPRVGEEGTIRLGPDASAAVTGVASSEGVQYFVLENHSSMQEGKSDAGLYDHMEPTKGLYDTTQQGGNVRQGDHSYSHIGPIHTALEEGDYHVAHVGVDVKSLDDTYNHTFETNG